MIIGKKFRGPYGNWSDFLIPWMEYATDLKGIFLQNGYSKKFMNKITILTLDFFQTILGNC